MKSPTTPPQLAQRFLLWFLKRDLAEEVIGDMEEQYFEQLEKYGEQRAQLNYYYQVLNYLRPFAIRGDLLNTINPFFMLRSNFKIAWRSLLKNKLNSIINITGMTIGMTCFILIGLYIQYETSFDQQHEKADRIYRIAQTQKGNEFRGSEQFAVAPMTIGPTMKEKFPEVEAATTLTNMQYLFWKGEQTIYETGLLADEFLFDVFSYPTIAGDAAAALKDRDAIILTASLAQKYFGHNSPINQTIKISSDQIKTVKAVIEDIPENQHFDFDFILSIENYGEYREDRDRWRWASNNYSAYVVLAEGQDYQQLEKKLSIFDEEVTAAYAGLPFKAEYFLQPLTDIHLLSQINFESEVNGDIRYIYLAASIAFIILLLALINYMNLTNASFGQRFKELGVRKVLGARKHQLISQLMTESVLVTLIGFSLALACAYFLLPGFNRLMDLPIAFEFWEHKSLFLSLLALLLSLGILSGLYPALLSSSVVVVNAIKGNWHKNKREGSFFRSALLIGQFTAAIVLAASSIVVYQQLQYIQHKKLGYEREQIVYVPYRNQDIYDKAPTLVRELQQQHAIEQVSIARTLPTNTYNQGILDEWEGNDGNQEIYIYRLHTDQAYLDLFEIELLEGRNLTAADTLGAYIINESAVKAIGWTSAVGKSFRDGKVIGVVKDFHFQPFDLAIEPIFITHYTRSNAHYFGHITMKIKADPSQETVAHIQQTIKEILPEVPFDFNYLDESYNALYASEKRFGKAFNISTMLALFIACIGLFGLVTHQVLQRFKEIGIRKVLGASSAQIVQLISSDFLKLVAVSAVIAIPIAWWGMSQWLQNFAYRIEMSWWVFILAGLVATGIAFATIGIKSLQAAWANPVDAIKAE